MKTLRSIGIGLAVLLAGNLGLGTAGETGPQTPPRPGEERYAAVEVRLTPLATRLGKPRPGEWLFEHKEQGQTFDEYQAAQPVRRSQRWRTIYLCLIGEFSPEQKRVLDLTREYLELFYDVPVKIHKEVPRRDIPARAQRKHPTWGDEQILTTYVLNDLLKPERPDDALAYVAFTATDLWPGEGWNFVFGQASLRDRTGVWSLYRNGDPSRGAADFRRCLERTLGTASHETGHILTMRHCTAYECSMNGSNSQAEADGKPLHLCPVCLRKLCWNLQVEPVPYLRRLEKFCRAHDLADEADWYARALAALKEERGK
jgi:archaemetzincin